MAGGYLQPMRWPWSDLAKVRKLSAGFGSVNEPVRPRGDKTSAAQVYLRSRTNRLFAAVVEIIAEASDLDLSSMAAQRRPLRTITKFQRFYERK